MRHWNSNITCVIDLETSGFDANHHEIVQICILPVTPDLTVDKTKNPFYITMKPDFPTRVDKKAMFVNKLKMSDLKFSQEAGFSLFESWFEKVVPFNRGGYRAKIIPIGQNYAQFDAGFLKVWLDNFGFEYHEFFHSGTRDTQTIASFINDRHAMKGSKPPFDNCKLSTLCNKYNVENVNAHDALADCQATLEVYRHMCKDAENMIGTL